MSVHGAGEVCKDTKESRECGHLGRNNHSLVFLYLCDLIIHLTTSNEGIPTTDAALCVALQEIYRLGNRAQCAVRYIQCLFIHTAHSYSQYPFQDGGEHPSVSLHGVGKR